MDCAKDCGTGLSQHGSRGMRIALWGRQPHCTLVRTAALSSVRMAALYTCAHSRIVKECVWRHCTLVCSAALSSVRMAALYTCAHSRFVKCAYGGI
eukprot:896806-Pelagomonas_calceolata.AAC.1